MDGAACPQKPSRRSLGSGKLVSPSRPIDLRTRTTANVANMLLGALACSVHLGIAPTAAAVGFSSVGTLSVESSDLCVRV